MKRATMFSAALLALGFVLLGWAMSSNTAPEAPSGFDNHTIDPNFVPQSVHAADQTQFDTVEQAEKDGLGPIYNAQSCRECHQNPTSGAVSQITELRVGHLSPGGIFENPSIPIDRGQGVITGRTLINDRAICPEVQEHVPGTETIRTRRRGCPSSRRWAKPRSDDLDGKISTPACSPFPEMRTSTKWASPTAFFQR